MQNKNFPNVIILQLQNYEIFFDCLIENLFFLLYTAKRGPVVQRLEPPAHNGVVVSSNLTGPTSVLSVCPSGRFCLFSPFLYPPRRYLPAHRWHSAFSS